ncbi:MAG: hypothetical protein Q9M30_03810, partial [Mariprofundaceae bacterium]|nr:hypothetical protein [Mariprofundaceae bacterium]
LHTRRMSDEQNQPLTLNGFESLAYRVRQGQARLCRGRKISIAELHGRDTWARMATELAAHYFPVAARRKLTIQLAEVSALNRAALALYPLQYRLSGTLKPDWWHATVLSWLRRAASRHTNQFWFARFPVEGTPDPERSGINLQQATGASDADASLLVSQFEIMDDMLRQDSRRTELARLIYLPWAFAHVDQEWNKQVMFTAYPSQRSKMRAAKQGTVSYLRINGEVWMLADKYAAKRHDVPGGWKDVREGASINWLDFCITWKDGGQKSGFDIRVDNAARSITLTRMNSQSFHDTLEKLNINSMPRPSSSKVNIFKHIMAGALLNKLPQVLLDEFMTHDRDGLDFCSDWGTGSAISMALLHNAVEATFGQLKFHQISLGGSHV